MELQVWRGDWGLPSIDPQCLTLITYCKMCGQDIPPVTCAGNWNGNKLPVLSLPNTQEYLNTPQNIINFLLSHEISLDEHLADKTLSEMTAYISLITESLYTALLCSWWLEEDNFQNVIKPLYASVFKFPLNFIKPLQMRRYIRCMILSRYSLDDNVEVEEVFDKVYEAGKRSLQILSTKLGDNQYIFGTVPSQLDAYLFGHLALIRSAPLPTCKVKQAMSRYLNLEEYALRIHRKYYPKLYRLYAPEQNDKLLSNQTLHKLASVSALLLIAGIFIIFRSGNSLLINDRPLESDPVE